MNPANGPIQRDSSGLHGRLTAMPTTNPLDFSTLQGNDQLSIDFPAMPDSIELIRSAEYVVTTPINLADGIHQFKGTQPLEIPFSFRVHSFDQQYCQYGALTLLQLAARLHSFVMPIEAGDGSLQAQAGEPMSNTDEDYARRASEPNGGLNAVSITGNKVTAPVTCRLELIFTGQSSPGIACTGYVRQVSVKLNGPWLRGPGNSSNLPSSADFSFIFVHNPGHGNSRLIDIGDRSAQAYAHTVKDQLYNTRQLTAAAAAGYQGLTDPPPVPRIPGYQTGGNRIRRE